MTDDVNELREKNRRANRVIGWIFFGALVANPPLNKYVLIPLAELITGMSDAMLNYVLAGAIGGAVFGGVIWLVGLRLTRHRHCDHIRGVRRLTKS